MANPGTVQYQNPATADLNLASTVVTAGAVPTLAEGTFSVPSVSGGLLNFHSVSASGTNAASIKGAMGQVYYVDVFNNAPYPVYVKLHNTATAPTAGVGVVRTIGVGPGERATFQPPVGIAFGTGIGLTIVGGIADADASPVAAGDCVVDVGYT